jgi:hypothetical protein
MISVKVWRRHSADCPHKADRAYRKCTCRVWLEWCSDGQRFRESAKTRSWEQGQKIARAKEQTYERVALGEKPLVKAVTVEQALESFLDTKKGEGLDGGTLQKHHRTGALLLNYCRRNNLVYIRQLNLPHLTAHRAEWDGNFKSKLSRRNNQGRIEEPPLRPPCPVCGNNMLFHYGVDEPDFFECSSLGCEHREYAGSDEP